MDLTIVPVTALTGEVIIPGDKSISHRALMLSAIADGDSLLKGLLMSDDCWATLNILRACGVDIHVFQDTQTVQVKGVGLHGLKAPNQPLDCGNSGTTMRLLAGLLSGQSFETP